jgi:flagellar motor switch protein FliM
MSSETLQPYDFAAAARVKLPLRQKLNSWAKKSADMMVDQWAMMSQTKIEPGVESIDAKSFGEIQASWANPCSATELTFGEDAIPCLLVSENKQIRILVLDVLGGCDSETNQLPLTSVEVSITKLIFEMFIVSLSEGWPSQETLPFNIGNFEPHPDRSRILPADEQVLVCRLRVQVGESTVVVQLILPHVRTQTLVGYEAADSAASQSQPISKETISTIDVELVATLGNAEIDMADLTQLSPGDIVVLDQPVSSPLEIAANRQPVFTAWPGRKLNQQILKLQKVLEPGQ